MYDIKSIESGEKDLNILSSCYLTNSNSTNSKDTNQGLSSLSADCSSTHSSCSSNSYSNNNSFIMSIRRRRIFQRQACLLSVMVAFSLGLALGVFVPMIGISTLLPSVTSNVEGSQSKASELLVSDESNDTPVLGEDRYSVNHPSQKFPTIYEIQQQQQQQQHKDSTAYPVSFVKDEKLPAEEVFRNAFHLEHDKTSDDMMIVKKLDAIDGSIKEFKVQRTPDGLFRKGPEVRLSKPSVAEQVLSAASNSKTSHLPIEFISLQEQQHKTLKQHEKSYPSGIIDDHIYWGMIIERSLPHGFNIESTKNWINYVKTGVVARLETGCGRMQNRLIVFNDGRRACARYRQNTDQIQGELFSFYLGQLLNITNLAPSTASVIDLDSITWSMASQDISNAQWKSSRPVVLTKWLPDLEPAGIPIPFQPLERHLNKFDVWNITLGLDGTKPQKGLLDRLGATIDQSSKRRSADHVDVNTDIVVGDSSISTNRTGTSKGMSIDSVSDLAADLTSSSSSSSLVAGGGGGSDHDDDADADAVDDHHHHHHNVGGGGGGAADSNIDDLPVIPSIDDVDRSMINSTILERLVELAQWSDLIVFDYLIANLDRVVNNLYNYQWNADIMAAPAHNLARQTDSQLLVFLDNESGLLHGYRLLKKYEAYHGLLLDNLCVFRRPTINALQSLRDNGPGQQLQQLFERSTSPEVRDVLPPLPDKSIKILIDRIDRVLGQVQKCRDLFSDR